MLLLTGRSVTFVQHRCDYLASSAPFTNTQTYLLTSLSIAWHRVATNNHSNVLRCALLECCTQTPVTSATILPRSCSTLFFYLRHHWQHVTKWDTGQKSDFFHTPPAFDATVTGSPSEATKFGMEKLEWCGYPIVKNSMRIWLLVVTQYTNVTDGQADTAQRHRTRLCTSSRGKNHTTFKFREATDIHIQE